MSVRTPFILAAFVALTSCGNNKAYDGPREVIRFHPGITLREAVSPTVFDRLNRVTSGSPPYVYPYGGRHILHLELGDEIIEMRPGGWNSASTMTTGFFTHLNERGNPVADDARLVRISTDSGDLMPLSEARALAIQWCGQAERGFSSRSRYDVVERFDHYREPRGSYSSAEEDRPQYEYTQVCVVDSANSTDPAVRSQAHHLTFLIRLAGPRRGSSFDRGAENVADYILQVWYSQNIPE